MLIKDKSVRINDKTIKLFEGSCKSYNIYLARCVEYMHTRINGHRHSFKEVIKNAASNTLQDLDTTGDLFVLGLHLFFDHGVNDPTAFNKYLEFGILEITTQQP